MEIRLQISLSGLEFDLRYENTFNPELTWVLSVLVWEIEYFNFWRVTTKFEMNVNSDEQDFKHSIY